MAFDRQRLQNLSLTLAACAVTLLAAEIGIRLLVKPSEIAYGTLLGRELPPLRIVPGGEPPAMNPSRWDGQSVVDGQRISRGDLLGHFRTDPLLGYTYEESTVSANGWWQSNNVGARSRSDVEASVPAGKKRWLVFGESFTHGSRVPQEHAWPNILDAACPDLEVLNLAVDGYSMAQSLLRYHQVQPGLEHDAVLLMWVPDADLWRDINVVRPLAQRGWAMPLVMPRFLLDEDKLALAVPPYADPLDVYRENRQGISAGLHEHLSRYDRFYLPVRHEMPPVVGHSVLYRLGVAVWWEWANRRLRAGLTEPDSEALQVSRRIFEAMRKQAAEDGVQFALVILPIEHRWKEGTGLKAWGEMVSFVCTDGMECIDLLEPLRPVAEEDVDYAIDGAHFGPGMNRRIAEAVAEALGVWQGCGTAPGP